MRPKERIDNFIKKVDLEYLSTRWNTDINILRDIFDKEDINASFEKYWNRNVDQRFGQVLINLELIPDNFDIWIDDEEDILRGQGLQAREYLFWGTNYDINGEVRPKTIYVLIKELKSDHLKAIKIWFTDRGRKVPTVIEEEIKFRENESI